MKTHRNTFGTAVMLVAIAIVHPLSGQQIDKDRMNRDIKVAENVLATLIKQKSDGDRAFFPLNIVGSYQEGYGVIFVLPADYTTPIAFSISGADGRNVFYWDRALGVNSGDSRPRISGSPETDDRSWRLKDRRQLNLDSIRDLSNDRLIEAAKEFLSDYGDMLSQVPPDERIVITNRGDQPRMWVGQLVPAPNRTHLSIELKKSDLNQFKEGKITRNELVNRITVVNAKALDEVEPDLELLSTIFNRLYRQDLAKTYFTEGNISYERLKDFGVVYYMQVFSSNRTFNRTYDMPTVGLHDIGQDERDVKVKELYPMFEKELKENIVEYGRTIKSLGDDELLVFNVTVTQCSECGIPASVEMSVKGSALKGYNTGKLDRDSTLGTIAIKRGPDQ